MKTGIIKLNQLQVVVALLAFGLLAGASGSAAAAVRIEGQVQASGSPLANSTVTLWQASAAHDVQVRPCISQGFGCMPCKKRSGLSGPMGISSKLIICALPKGSFSSIS
jgi:hypothetical protein